MDVLNSAGYVRYVAGDFAAAQAFYLERLRLAQEFGALGRVAGNLQELGIIAWIREQYLEAVNI